MGGSKLIKGYSLKQQVHVPSYGNSPFIANKTRQKTVGVWNYMGTLNSALHTPNFP